MMVLPTAYWGPLEWFRCFTQDTNDSPLIEVYDSFPKQTLRNRCIILDPTNQPVMLTVPVKKVESKQLTRDVEISYQQHWQHQHWNAILSAYKKSPYFDYYADFIRPLYEREFTFLLDLNEATYAVAAALMRNEMPRGKDRLRRTDRWYDADLEAHWGDQLSILDGLFKKGPMLYETDRLD